MAKSDNGRRAYDPMNHQEPIPRPELNNAELDGRILGSGGFRYATGRDGVDVRGLGKQMLKHVHNPKITGT